MVTSEDDFFFIVIYEDGVCYVTFLTRSLKVLKHKRANSAGGWFWVTSSPPKRGKGM